MPSFAQQVQINVGPWKKMTDKEFRKGVDGKMMGQINLVLIGQHYINPKGSFFNHRCVDP